MHKIKFDGYRMIARNDGDRVRLWARTTSDYSKAFTRIRDAVALSVDSAVLDEEAIVMRSADRWDFKALTSRQEQAEAILVAYDIMEVDGQDVRPEPLEERRKRLAGSNRRCANSIPLSEAITGGPQMLRQSPSGAFSRALGRCVHPGAAVHDAPAAYRLRPASCLQRGLGFRRRSGSAQ